MRSVLTLHSVVALPYAAALLLAFASLSPTVASAQRLETLFSEGNAAFYAGEYAEAIAKYEQIEEAGVVDADVAHNLGTAHAKLGHYGRAVLYLERSLDMEPGTADTLHNLEETRRALAERLTAARGEVETMDSRGLSESVVRNVASNALAIALLVFWALAFLGLLVRQKSTRARAKLVGALVAVLSLVFSAVLGVLLAAKEGVFQEGDPAIVIAPDNTLLEGPDPRSTTRGEAFEGERANIVAADGDYLRVDFGGGRTGWLPAESVGAIRQ